MLQLQSPHPPLHQRRRRLRSSLSKISDTKEKLWKGSELSKTHLWIPDPHAHYEHHNRRAEWVGKLINDIKPDVVVCGGDSADMPSLASYDKGKRSFQGRTYRADVDAHLDFQDRLWSVVKATKKKLPDRYFLEGNHEHRIARAIEFQPELEGVVGLSDLEISRYYDVFVPYEGSTPGVIDIDGILFAHYFVSGVMGQPIGGVHPAASLIAKLHRSAVAFHLHLADYNIHTDGGGRKIHSLVAGVYQDYEPEWAGRASKLWWQGVIVARNIDGTGNFDPQFISLEALKKEYS